MSLLDVLRGGIKIADQVTKPLQASVTYYRATSHDAYGNPIYAGPVVLRAIVDYRQQQVRTKDGTLTSSRLVVTFLDTSALSAATQGEGITDEDKIVLPNGETGPIIALSGFLDAGTGEPIPTEVSIG